MTLSQIRYVIEIANSRSMNEAAKKLFISQPSLSNAISELERELQISIFARNNKGVVITSEGEEFLIYARQILQQMELLEDKYINHTLKKKFGVSTQHYSFAVKAFVEMVKGFDMNEYEFAIRETKTYDVIDDVKYGRSEIGILYLDDFNNKVLMKLINSNELKFEELFRCNGYVYLYKGHPLAKNKIITMKELDDYPCLAFEQGTDNSFYFAEEILSTYNYSKVIKACDRATMLNLMVGLDGYTLCSGIICKELNGSDYIAIPLETDEVMRIGYITRKNNIISEIGNMYIDQIKKYIND